MNEAFLIITVSASYLGFGLGLYTGVTLYNNEPGVFQGVTKLEILLAFLLGVIGWPIIIALIKKGYLK